MNEETLKEIEEYFERWPVELDWDYDSQLTGDQIDWLLEGDRDRAVEDISESVLQWVWDEEDYAYKNVIDELDLLPEDGDLQDLIFEIRENGVYPIVDYNYDRLVRYTNAYIVARLEAEHDSYWRDYDDVAIELDWLGVNPADLIEWFPDVDWPEIRGRTEPLISAKDLAEGWINAGYTGYWYVMLDAHDVLNLAMRGELKGKVRIKKGANMIIHDYWNGASSMNEMLQRDIEVDISVISQDGNNRYGIQSCCGFVDDAWNGEVECIPQSS